MNCCLVRLYALLQQLAENHLYTQDYPDSVESRHGCRAYPCPEVASTLTRVFSYRCSVAVTGRGRVLYGLKSRVGARKQVE